MSGPLTYLTQRADAIKRRFKDLTADPVARLSADLENILADYKEDPLTLVGPHIPTGGLTGVVKNKGGNWMGDGTPWLNHLKRRPGVTRPAEDPHTFDGMTEAAIARAQRDFNIDDWIDKKIVPWVKNNMGTESDPIRKLIDQGVSHVPEVTPDIGAIPHVYRRRAEKGFPGEGMATTELGKDWENLTDWYALPDKAKDYLPGGRFEPVRTWENRWLDKLNPEDDVHSLDVLDAERLGFKHLVDEIGNQLDPNSNFPRELRLTPEQLDMTSLPDMIRNVAKVNAWREKQALIANQKIANNEATHLVKEYPEHGMKWVELKVPEVVKKEPQLDVDGFPIDHYVDRTNEEALRRALKYEGDTMGHCVGGYCEDVIDGGTRIFSLRDAKGKPHVTIEVKPETTRANFQDEDTVETIAPRIVQVKGKSNRRPNKKYQPFITDFIRENNYKITGDMEYTDFVDAGPYTGNYIEGIMTRQELADKIVELEKTDPLFGRYDHSLWVEDLLK